MAKIFLVVFFFILLAGVIVIAQRFYLNTSSRQSQEKIQKEAQIRDQKASQDFYDLIEKQKQNQSTTPDKTYFTKKVLTRQRVKIILTKPKGLDGRIIEPLVNKLKEKSNNYTSLDYIDSYISGQAKKHNVSNAGADIEVLGPFSLTSINKLGDIGLVWNKDPFGSAKLADTFNLVLEENNIKKEDGEAVLFIYFDNSFDQAAVENVRFYEHKAFRSFANQSTSKAYINAYDFSPGFAQTLVEIAIHEFLHLFGASDKYEERDDAKRICKETGRGETGKNPPLPQTTTDIMCGFVELSEINFKKGSLQENNIVINEVTAEEIGWKK